MTVSDVARPPVDAPQPGGLAGRLGVAWQDPITRSYSPVGILQHDQGGYTFRYVRQAADLERFRPLLGFPELDRTYKGTHLFPLFAQRVMDRRRPDYGRYTASLGLTEDASPAQLLARSEGRRIGDQIRVFPEPIIQTDSTTEYKFFVHGVRYALQRDPSVDLKLEELRPNDSLLFVDEPDNQWNTRAVVVTTADGTRLGYVPDVLLDYVREVRGHGGATVTVVQVNSDDVPPPFRIIVRMAGHAPPGYRPFGGTQWSLIARDGAASESMVQRLRRRLLRVWRWMSGLLRPPHRGAKAGLTGAET